MQQISQMICEAWIVLQQTYDAMDIIVMVFCIMVWMDTNGTISSYLYVTTPLYLETDPDFLSLPFHSGMWLW